MKHLRNMNTSNKKIRPINTMPYIPSEVESTEIFYGIIQPLENRKSQKLIKIQLKP